MQNIHFSQDAFFSYNRKKKKFMGMSIISIASSLTIILAILTYYLWATDSLFIEFVKQLSSNIVNSISKGTVKGSIYASLFGGLFFIVLPVELLYVNFLRNGIPSLQLIGIYIFGVTVSYTINYYLGRYLAKVVKFVIGYDKFYKTKGIINRYGNLAIFIFNALPLPSQQLTTILGVFNYNKTKFYTFTILGQIVKYILITVIVINFI